MLTLHDLTYRFPDADRDAVAKVSLTVRPGESLAVMGPNGSGKSTLARLIAGLLEPTQGHISIGDYDHTDLSDQVGMLFQNPDNQMVSVLVDKEVAFALENRAVPMKEMGARVTESLAAFEITHLANRVTSYLSSGEKQRVALASLMIYQPPILILDEPDSYLDAAGRGLLRTQLQTLHEQYPDLIEIRITQYPEVSESYPRLIVMDEGKIVADGPTSAMTESPVFRELAPPAENGKVNSSAANASAVLECHTISFAYEPSQPVLHDLSFTLKGGESIAIVGPTGCGKSTLGLLLAELLSPIAGEIRIEPSDPQQLPIAPVFQQPERQFFLNTVSEELAYGPKHRGHDLTKTDINRYLNEIGLPPERYADRDPLSLSMGEKRRLAIGVAIALDPAFILFDEPTAGLDPEGVSRFVELARDLRRRGLGLLCITHERRLLEQLADRVLILAGDGTASELSTLDFLATGHYQSLVWPQPTNKL